MKEAMAGYDPLESYKELANETAESGDFEGTIRLLKEYQKNSSWLSSLKKKIFRK